MARVLLLHGHGTAPEALDDVIDPAGADVVAALVSGPLHRLLLANSGHVATHGSDLDELLTAVVGLISETVDQS